MLAEGLVYQSPALQIRWKFDTSEARAVVQAPSLFPAAPVKASKLDTFSHILTLSLRSKKVGGMMDRLKDKKLFYDNDAMGLFAKTLHMVKTCEILWKSSQLESFVAGRVVAVASFGIASTCAARSMELRFKSARSMRSAWLYFATCVGKLGLIAMKRSQVSHEKIPKLILDFGFSPAPTVWNEHNGARTQGPCATLHLFD